MHRCTKKPTQGNIFRDRSGFFKPIEKWFEAVRSVHFFFHKTIVSISTLQNDLFFFKHSNRGFDVMQNFSKNVDLM